MPPQVFASRWEVVRSLGEGGQGHTFLVVDTKGSHSKQYVLKRLKNADNPNRLHRFKQEVEVLRSVNHPAITNIIDFDVDARRPFFVTDYYEGGPLTDLPIAELGTTACLSLFMQLCEGLSAVHNKGIVHRDIKPENIVCDVPLRLVICDFGLSYVEGGERHTLLDEAVGGRNFMAPELEDGRFENVTPAADVYALGKLLYWMLSGGIVFSREKHRSPDYDLNSRFGANPHTEMHYEHVSQLLDDMITTEPTARLKSAAFVVERVREVRRLIEGNYAPLTGEVAHSCRYCGKGEYDYVLDGSNPTAVNNFGLRAVGGDRPFHAMRCDTCGHIQLFRHETWWGPA